MFDISWGELLLIGVVALVFIGPKELPTVLRTVGQWMGKLRRMASEFQSQFHEAMREAEMSDLKKQVDEMTTQAQGYANFDPVSEVRKELDSTQQQIESAMADKPKSEIKSEIKSETTSDTSSPTATAPSPEAQSPAVSALSPPAEPAVAPSAGGDVTAPAAPEPATVGAGSVLPDAGGKPA
jgi:sec-independent protein translocase protein TatB